MHDGRVLSRSVPLWLALVLVLAVSIPVSVAVALTINTITERLGLWQASFPDTHFTIQSFSLSPKGPNRVIVAVTLRNTDASAAHTADVTVQLLDASGNVIAEQTQSTGSVAPNGTWSHTFTFTAPDITSQVQNVMIIVKQTG
jgi:SLAP domain-containing protein